MRTLIDIIGDSKVLSVAGALDIEVQTLQIDSRAVKSSDVYVAMKGLTADGHDFIDSAIANGAAAVLCTVMPAKLQPEVTYVQVAEIREVLGEMASRYYGDPSRSITLVGVTGTNGKTTVATLLYQLFGLLGYKVGLISTVENRIANEVIPATHTTPDVVSLNGLLRQMVDAGCEYAFMEVSSHSVDQRRIAGVQFAGAVFTNMSHDHLDYHKTFDNYIAAKKRFFDDLDTGAFALTNVDDKRGEVMLQNTAAEKLSYGLHKMCTYKGRIISNSIEGLALKLNGQEAHFRMIGSFNAYNLLAVYGVATRLGFEPDEVLTAMSRLEGALGRFEKVQVEKTKTIGIVDYAHTPDALENVLETIRAVKESSRRVITVVGCGGDRDKTKRPVMAQVASRLSSRVILTSDNPRTEDPEEILDQMEAGLAADSRKNVLRITDRKQAIKTAAMLATDGDIILIAGKGHETYQDINGVKHPFDDKKVLTAAMLEST